MIGKTNYSHRFWSVASLGVILFIGIFDLKLILAPEMLQVQYIPDDGFYYLGVAKNFSRLGWWTFDSGFSTTSGFHPLFAYLLTILDFTLQPTSDQFIRYGLALSSLITLIPLLFIWVLWVREGKTSSLLVVTWLISSKNYLYNSVSILEWPLVIFFAGLYYFYFFRTNHHTYQTKHLIALFLIGLGGSLSRSDFGLFPFCFFIATLILVYFNKQRGAVIKSFAGLMGTVSGVGIIFIHNQIFTGQFLQSSAMMKAYWAQIYGTQYRNVFNLLLDLIGLDFLGFWIGTLIFGSMGVIGLMLFIWNHLKTQKTLALWEYEDRKTQWLLPLLTSSLCLGGYVWIYSYSGVQPWYSTNFVVPLFILLSTFAEEVRYRANVPYRNLVIANVSLITISLVIRNLVSVLPMDSTNAPWVHQKLMLRAGQYLSEQTLMGRVGAWNAGIIGYFQGGKVINLDGLMNDQIYDYAVNNQLPTYLSQNEIKYIVDFDIMFEVTSRRKRGGYNDKAFLDSLQPLKVFDDPDITSEWNRIILYEIQP